MLIQNARLVDARGETRGDVLTENGRIAAVGPHLTAPAGCEAVDAAGLVLMPAFIDMHCHFRTPGFEYKEDVRTGSRAAAHGGYTYVTCMANTKPVCSSGEIAEGVMAAARAAGLCEVNQCVSITRDFDGKTLSHLETLPDSVRCISEDGHGVQNNFVMWQAMCIAREKGLLVLSHAEDADISPVDYRLAENIETARNILLAEYTGARLHLCHVSTAEAIADVAAAKRRGAHVTCEVTPHHLWFADDACDYRVNPPIRTAADVAALVQAVRAGTVDAIGTDHAPHSAQDKAAGAAGMVGLETSFAVCHTKLCVREGLPLALLSRLLSRGPAQILGLNKGLLAPGFDADLVLADTAAEWQVDPAQFQSKSRNTPFGGTRLSGLVKATVKAGRFTYTALEKGKETYAEQHGQTL